MIRDELITKIKEMYPYYSNLGKLNKEQLEEIYNRKCHVIRLSYNNNSCYMDTLLVALFHTKNRHIFDMFFRKQCTSILEKNIQKQLYLIYYSLYDKTIYCTELRKSLNYYLREHGGEQVNWSNEQLDPTQLLQYLDRIFNYEDNVDTHILNYVGNTLQERFVLSRNRQKYFIYNINIDDIYGHDMVDLSTLIPVRNKRTTFDKDNLVNGQYKYLFSKEIMVKCKFLYIDIPRIVPGVGKLDTVIIPPIKIKLVGNREPLYLKSLIVHMGNEYGGHYICIYECRGDWYMYDDLNIGLHKIDTFMTRRILSNVKALIYF